VKQNEVPEKVANDKHRIQSSCPSIDIIFLKLYALLVSINENKCILQSTFPEAKIGAKNP